MSEPAQLGAAALEAAVREAESGAREIGGNNEGAFVEKYLNANHPERVTHTGEKWCAAFFCWCWLQAAKRFGISLPVGYTRGSSVLFERMKELGQVQLRVDARPEQQQPLQLGPLRPEPGDAVFYDYDGDGSPNHVNMVHHVDEAGDLWTIGGNEGSEQSGAPVRIKNRGPLLQVPHLFAVGWMAGGRRDS